MSFVGQTPWSPTRLTRQYSVDDKAVLFGAKGYAETRDLTSVLKTVLSQGSFDALTSDDLTGRETDVRIAEKIFKSVRDGFIKQPSAPSPTNPTHVWATGLLPTMEDLKTLFEAVHRIISSEPVLLSISPSPVYIIGDIHGNYNDLSKFLEIFGLLRYGDFVPAKFVFLGDYVDRGAHDVECLLLLMSLKVLYPRKVYLLRGNHEWLGINGNLEKYGVGSFSHHAISLFGKNAEYFVRSCNIIFSFMPLACVIDNSVFCVHGGIPREFGVHPDRSILDKIRTIPKPINGFWPEFPSLIGDLQWGDPFKDDGRQQFQGYPPGFGPSDRGEGIANFSERLVPIFLEQTGLQCMVRAHQAVENGCQISCSGKLFTVFSSSDSGRDSKACALLVYENTIKTIYIDPTDGSPAIVIPK